MARFYTTSVNGRGNDTGNIQKEGESVHTRGWNAGVKVVPVGVKGERDQFQVYMTTGSHTSGHDVLLGTVHDTEDGPVFILAGDEMSEDAARNSSDPNHRLYVHPDNRIS